MQPSHDSQCNSLQPVFCREYTTETTFSQCTSHKPWIFLLTMRVLEEVCIWVDPIQMGDNEEPANPGVPLLSDSYSVENLTICATQYMIAKTELSIQYNPFYSFLPNFLCNPSNFELSYLPILRITIRTLPAFLTPTIWNSCAIYVIGSNLLRCLHYPHYKWQGVGKAAH